jgi:hypothetical protein
MPCTRRTFLATGTAATANFALGISSSSAQTTPPIKGLAGQIGITMSSIARLATDAGPLRYSLDEWPKILRNELDMTILDLNSGVVESHEPGYLERVRKAADAAGCVMTNLKINRGDVDIGNADPAVRAKALAECKLWLDTAGRLGLRWARPLPLKTTPDYKAYVASYRELADYAGERGVQMIVENYGWMDSDAETVPRLLKDVGKNVAPAPDTGNWTSDDVRYAGLAKLFPTAVTCDFKAGKLGPSGEHTAWDLKRCFDIAWRAGFRGPWCLEHADADRAKLFGELGLLREMLRKWTAEAEES